METGWVKRITTFVYLDLSGAGLETFWGILNLTLNFEEGVVIHRYVKRL